MLQKLTKWFGTHEIILVIFLVLLFLIVRLPGTSLPLHQDEYKWPLAVNPATVSFGATIPHPPLGELIYRMAGYMIGFSTDFRFVPLLFGLCNLLLLYYFLRQRCGKKVATVGSLIFILSYFSVLASLMVDTDGAIMPFFFLLSLIAYDKMRTSSGPVAWKWWILLILACLGGFFIKVSFLLVICALVADFLWDKKEVLTHNDTLKYTGYIFSGLCFLALLLFISQYFFPFFNLSSSFVYWLHFADIHRNWFQIGIQVIKVILYSSPLLIILPFLIEKKDIQSIRPFLFYLLFAFIFYIILFDFSLGALDRYLQCIIVPLCSISAVVLVSIFSVSPGKKNKEYILLGTLCAFIFLLCAFVPHTVPSLHPKSAWIGRALSLKWNFLYPFSGGSGPLGFYISFLFMALSWICSIALGIYAFFKPDVRKVALLVLIPISLVYSGFFIEEYLFGMVYGSAAHLLPAVVQFIQNDPAIQHVTVYNDNGGWEIRQSGKYRSRLYTDPAFNIVSKVATLNQYKETYLEINIPRIDPTSVYRTYLDSCTVIYNETDKYISAKVYDCSNAPDVHT